MLHLTVTGSNYDEVISVIASSLRKFKLTGSLSLTKLSNGGHLIIARILDLTTVTLVGG